MNPPSLQYKDWNTLKTHLLWSYQGKINEQESDSDILSYSKFKNNGAWLIRKGWAEVVHNGQTVRAQPGQWLIVKPVERMQRFAADTELLSISFDAIWPDGSKLLCQGLTQCIDSSLHPQLEQYALKIVEMTAEMTRKNRDIQDILVNSQNYLRIQGELNIWLSVLLPVLNSVGVSSYTHGAIDQRVLDTLSLIDLIPLNKPMLQQQLATKIGISSVHLTRLFKQELKTTPHHYFEKLRLEAACRRLHVPHVRVNEVAIELGFKYPSHFTSWFHKHLGVNPKNYKINCSYEF